MANPSTQSPFTLFQTRIIAFLAAPAMAIFITSNLVNVGNLSFNLIFSRWMGPELFGDLTLLLTLKLALLGVLGAFQSAISQLVAATPAAGQDRLKRILAVLNKSALVFGFVVLPLAIFALYVSDTRLFFGVNNERTLLLLLVSLPFAASLSILRGVALGALYVRGIVRSAIVEMGVRLIFAILAWQLGLGLVGVVLAIVLSIGAGWLVLTDLLPKPSRIPSNFARFSVDMGLKALPFGVLYFAQVLALDGDIFIAKAILPSEDAGLVAALLLFQRIQFFACFALASILLPSVISAARGHQKLLPSLAPILGLFGLTALIFLALVKLYPDVLIRLLVGADYAAASEGLMLAAVSAVAFTLSFLIATFLAAIGDRRGIWITALVAVAQLGIMLAFTNDSSVTFMTILQIKSVCQVALTLGLSLYAGVRVMSFASTLHPNSIERA